jgi:hypothetical protein
MRDGLGEKIVNINRAQVAAMRKSPRPLYPNEHGVPGNADLRRLV